jgi:hypothetical protein
METKMITKLLKETQIGIPFRAKNKIQNIVKPHPQIDKYGRNGMYQIKYMDCQLKYMGQTGRMFYTRYKEQIQAIRNNKINSGYLNHILSTGHT